MKIFRILFTCILTLIGVSTFAHSAENTDSLIQVYTKRMNRYMDRDSIDSSLFVFTKDGIRIYAPATDTSAKQFDFRIQWKDIHAFKNALAAFSPLQVRKMISDSVFHPDTSIKSDDSENTFKKLADYKIALDPGHIAGDIITARREGKCVEMQSPPLLEGELTLATALLLKMKLEQSGATVMMTRSQTGQSGYGIDYKKWKDSLFTPALDSACLRGDVSIEEKQFLLTKANDTVIFRKFFLQEDVRERAKKINAFHPDLTLIIHYNVDEANVGWNKPTHKDYNMTFVGGSFFYDELKSPVARIEFLRLLLTNDIEKSAMFSKYIIEGLVQGTKIPAAKEVDAAYLQNNCLSTNIPGVYCRNLILTRKVKGILCYGESLYQDNINEYIALGKKEVRIERLKTSKRIEEVAESYYQGILNYVRCKNSK